MARRKLATDERLAREAIGRRLKEIRTELFGDHGGPEMAREIGVPPRTWYNYEMGVTVPAHVILHFIVYTSVAPTWLLHGRGDKFRSPENGSSLNDLFRRVSHCLERGRLCINVSWEEYK